MWYRSNWCERIILISSVILLFLLLLDVFVDKAVLSIWSLLYAISLTVFTIWITCRDIQFLLEQNAPLKNESKDLLEKHSKVNFLCLIIPVFQSFLTAKDNSKLLKDNGQSTKKKYIDTSFNSDISMIASVVERKCVWSWYSQYVSKEIAFPFACKELLDQVVTKLFQISVNMDTVKFYSDSLGIILRHCKEYKRAKKRLTKIGQGTIEEYYRNTHPTSSQRNSHTISTKGKSTQSHCLIISRAFLKELLPWELWGTPQYLLLASILAKRLDNFISASLSNPTWLRNKIINMIDKSEQRNDLTVDSNMSIPSPNLLNENVNEIEVEQKILNDSVFIEPVKENNEKEEITEGMSVGDFVIKTSIESALSNMISNTTAPILQRAEIEDNPSKNIFQSILPVSQDIIINKTAAISVVKKPSQPIDITNSPSHGNNGAPVNKLKNSNEVKVYDRVVEGSVKTWNSDVDLECVSLGQDLLASLDSDMGFESRLGRLWEADCVDSSETWSPNPPSTGSSTKNPHGLWFGEEDNLDLDLTEESPPKNTVQNNTSHSYSNFNITKPLSIHNMKELQNISKNTVNQAKHKIGDLQDEAAGMMEGILDFGIAGLRKGLRLTGLQESPTEKGPSHKSIEGNSNNLVSTLGQVLTSSRKNSQTDDNIKSDSQKAILNKGSDSLDATKLGNSQQPVHLVKQQRVTSQDSSYFANTNKEKDTKDMSETASVQIEPIQICGDSPDYEYEEPADFASTIAKLRNLLQQKTGDITPISQDDASIPSSTFDSTLIPSTKPTSATQPNNSPVHKLGSFNSVGNEFRMEDMMNSPSIETENGFTILSQNSADLFEAEEALNHKIGPSSISLHPQSNANNLQRLDKLFTRTVTGVFNTIKTAVGGDSLTDAVSGHTEVSSNAAKQTIVRAHQHKDDWIFVEGDMDVSTLVSKLLIERRGFCVVEVEAAQDTLEIFNGSGTESQSKSEFNTPTSSVVHDDLDESEVITGCPLYHICMELISVVVGGIMQKDAVTKCISVLVADMVESNLREKFMEFNSCIAGVIIESLQDISKDKENDLSQSKTELTDTQQTTDIDELYNILYPKIPEISFTLFGEEEIVGALKMLLYSIDNSLINRDVIFNLIDVAMLHFLKACSNQSYLSTPPPSA